MEHVISQLHHGPAENLVHIYKAVFVLVAGELGIFRNALRAAVRVNDSLAPEQTADCRSLGRHYRRNDRVVGPARGADQVRHGSDYGHGRIHLSHAVHHVGHCCGFGGHSVVTNIQRHSVIGRAALQQFHNADIGVGIVPVVEHAVIRIPFQRNRLALFASAGRHCQRTGNGGNR